MTDDPSCEDCRHVCRAKLFDGRVELLCGHSAMLSRKTGKPATSCRWARQNDAACGRDARWFQEC